MLVDVNVALRLQVELLNDALGVVRAISRHYDVASRLAKQALLRSEIFIEFLNRVGRRILSEGFVSQIKSASLFFFVLKLPDRDLSQPKVLVVVCEHLA